MTGSLRSAQEKREQAATVTRKQEFQRKQRELDRKRKTLEAQIASLRVEFDAVEEESKIIAEQDLIRENVLDQERASMETRRAGARDAAPKTLSGRNRPKERS